MLNSDYEVTFLGSRIALDILCPGSGMHGYTGRAMFPGTLIEEWYLGSLTSPGHEYQAVNPTFDLVLTFPLWSTIWSNCNAIWIIYLRTKWVFVHLSRVIHKIPWTRWLHTVTLFIVYIHALMYRMSGSQLDISNFQLIDGLHRWSYLLQSAISSGRSHFFELEIKISPTLLDALTNLEGIS